MDSKEQDRLTLVEVQVAKIETLEARISTLEDNQ